MTLQEYLIKLGFQADEPSLKKFMSIVSSVGAATAELGSTAVETATAIELMVARVARTYESLYYGSPSDYTNASGINTAGVVVGFATEGGPYQGWVRGTDGVFTSINVPLAVETYALGVNDLGQICGEWTDGAGHRHGFIRDVAGALVTVDFPGATDTGLCGISNTGIIVGYFGGADGSSQGFYATVPEPATLTLLWVGGLLTLRRRQRA